jgi:hypothetical protein
MDSAGSNVLAKNPLLQPLTIKKLTLRNRIMSTSHACGLEVGGMPQEAYQRYHEEKARGGLALSMFGGSSNIDRDSPNIFRQLNVGSDEIIPHLQRFSVRMHLRVNDPPWRILKLLEGSNSKEQDCVEHPTPNGIGRGSR